MSDITVDIGGDSAGILAAMAEAKAAVTEATANMRESFESVAGAFEKINVAMASVTAILAGGKVFGEAISASVSAAAGAGKLGRQLGITATQASILKVAMDENFVSTEAVEGASNKIATTLKKNENAFKELGVETRDSNGNFKNSFDIMTEVNAKLLTFKEGTDRNVEGMKIYGKAWAEIAPTLRLTEAAMEEAKETAEGLGLVVGKEGIAQTLAYRKAMEGMHAVFEAVEKQIGDALMPVLTSLGQWFKENGPAAIQIVKGSIVSLVAVFEDLKASAITVWNMMAAPVQTYTTFILTAFDAIAAAVKHPFSGDATAIWKTGMAQIAADAKERAGNVTQAWADAEKATTEFADRMAAHQTPTDEKTGAASTGGDGKEKSRLTEWETELAEKKAHDAEMNAANGVFVEFSKQQDLDYWKAILANAKLTLEERKAVRAKIAADELEIAKQGFEAELAGLKTKEDAVKGNFDAQLALETVYLEKVRKAYGENSKEFAAAQKDIIATKQAAIEQQMKLDDIRTQAVRNQQVAQIALEQEDAKARNELHLTSTAEYIAQEVAFEDRLYAIKKQALDDELKLASLDPKNAVQAAQLNAQLEALESQHQASLAKIRVQANAQAVALYKSFESTFENSMASAFKNVIDGTQTVGNAFKSMFASMVNSVVEAFAKIAAQWVTQHALQMALGVEQRASNAATAATGAGASAAAIPGIGWALAPVEMAATFAAASSYSAAQGYDVPAGVNPMTQLHPKEMVLPPPLADRVRDMTAPPPQQQGGDVHLHVNAIDAKGVSAFFKGNKTAIAAALKAHLRSTGQNVPSY